MKRGMLGILIMAILASAVYVSADPMEELIQSLGDEYEALTPAQVRALYVSAGLKPPMEVGRVSKRKRRNIRSKKILNLQQHI